MKVPLRKVHLSWKATTALAATNVALILLIGVAVDRAVVATALQLAVIGGCFLVLLRHSTPNR
jgi:hypothetical protein